MRMKKILQLTKQWVKILKLSEWTITVEIETEEKLKDNSAEALNSYVPTLLTSTILLPKDETDEQLEIYLIHELLHLNINEFFPKGLEDCSPVEYMHLDRQINVIAIALYNTKYGKDC